MIEFDEHGEPLTFRSISLTEANRIVTDGKISVHEFYYNGVKYIAIVYPDRTEYTKVNYL